MTTNAVKPTNFLPLHGMELHPLGIQPELIQCDKCHIQFWSKEIIPLNLAFPKAGINNRPHYLPFFPKFISGFFFFFFFYTLLTLLMALLFGPLTIGFKLQEWKRFMYEISTFDVSKTHARNKTAHLYLKVENTPKERQQDKYNNVRVSLQLPTPSGLCKFTITLPNPTPKDSHMWIRLSLWSLKIKRINHSSELSSCYVNPDILFMTNRGAIKKRNIDWPILFRKALVSKEIQQICAKMSS